MTGFAKFEPGEGSRPIVSEEPFTRFLAEFIIGRRFAPTRWLETTLSRKGRE
jgi:hypothetical protein